MLMPDVISNVIEGVSFRIGFTRYQAYLLVYPYEVSGRGCMISRVWNNRFNMPTRYSGWGCRISRVWNNRSNMPTRYHDGAAGSHGIGMLDRACPRGIRTGLQDLTCLEQQIQHAYEVLRMGLQNLTGLEQQIQHAYEVS